MQLKIGDVVFIGCRGRGGHGAYVKITKINRRSIKGTEEERSYKPGTQWGIGVSTEAALVLQVDGLMQKLWGRLEDSGHLERAVH